MGIGVTGWGDCVKLKRPNLSEQKTVDYILMEIRTKVPLGERVTIRQLRDVLFDSVQMTRWELVQFIKVHGDEVFDKCENPSHFRENYQSKSGVEQHGQ